MVNKKKTKEETRKNQRGNKSIAGRVTKQNIK